MRMPRFVLALVAGSAARDPAGAADASPTPSWPAAVREVWFPSAADGSAQPALFYAPPGDEPRPLLVALHTWSGDYLRPTGAPYAEGCIARGWVFIHPDFRGPNVGPEAAGSELAIEDVLSAVRYARQAARVDPTRIYLVGASGGGHMALLVAARKPNVWAGVSAWVPVTDLNAWYRECRQRNLAYADQIVRVAGGDPVTNPVAARECERRSPLAHLAAGGGLPVDLNAGIQDGHTGSVPISHTLLAFNRLAREPDRFSAAQIRSFAAEPRVPAGLAAARDDPSYGNKRVLFRRESGAVRVTIFDGGHEIIHQAALAWLAAQQKR